MLVPTSTGLLQKPVRVSGHLPYRVWRRENPALAAVMQILFIDFHRGLRGPYGKGLIDLLHKWPLLKSAAVYRTIAVKQRVARIYLRQLILLPSRTDLEWNVYIGWQWRNFVPYLCRLDFAAILWVKLSEMFVTVMSLKHASLVS